MERDIYHAKDEHKRAAVAILILDKVNFKIKSTIKDKEGYFIMMKGSIHQEDITTTWAHMCPISKEIGRACVRAMDLGK